MNDQLVSQSLQTAYPHLAEAQRVIDETLARSGMSDITSHIFYQDHHERSEESMIDLDDLSGGDLFDSENGSIIRMYRARPPKPNRPTSIEFDTFVASLRSFGSTLLVILSHSIAWADRKVRQISSGSGFTGNAQFLLQQQEVTAISPKYSRNVPVHAAPATDACAHDLDVRISAFLEHDQWFRSISTEHTQRSTGGKEAGCSLPVTHAPEHTRSMTGEVLGIVLRELIGRR